ncbi:hypothetical protein [Anaerohalosphaera lusitana]|uniref:hypothetical protein n=1 Tax=Anaerohalosphaera lusitana TaxID=1936003 RepID=UPI0011BA640B|nr:hypothetical protein [Anaerohalosphaera lusitana]
MYEVAVSRSDSQDRVDRKERSARRAKRAVSELVSLNWSKLKIPAIAFFVALGIVIVLSQLNKEDRQQPAGSDSGAVASPRQPAQTGDRTSSESTASSGNASEIHVTGGTIIDQADKDNAIVIASNSDKKQLQAVQEFFAGHGIGSELIGTGRTWLLVSSEKYAGLSDMKRPIANIKKVGKDYDPPEGYKPFSFNTVYGINESKL